MSYTHGRFTWFTLHSTDLARAKAFYTEVFGWSTEEMPMPDGSYTVFKNGKDGIGGLQKPPAEGLPSHWISYVSVADVDGTAKKIAAAGGKQLMDAFEIPNIGRACPVADDQGAAFMLFKGNDGDMPESPSANGDWHWNELWTNDAAKAKAFYTEQLGYETETMPMPQGDYTVLKKGDTPRGGLMKSPKDGVPPMWLGYVHVDDVDATAKRLKEHGGDIIAEPMDVPHVGRFGIAKDPTGAVIGFIKPAK